MHLLYAGTAVSTLELPGDFRAETKEFPDENPARFSPRPAVTGALAVPAAPRGAANGRAVGVQAPPQLGVEGLDPERALVHRREDEDLARGVEPVRRREPADGDVAHVLERVGRRDPLEEEEVADAVLAGDGRRRLARVDRVRGAHDQRARGLAEDLGEADGRDRAGLDEVLEDAARPDRARAGRRRRRAARASAGRPRRGARRRGGRESIEASSTISMSRPGIGSSGPREKPSPGTYSSSRWIVLASAPVSSPSRRAALPVGAHSRTLRFWSRSRSTSARIVCVLPVPGRPVRIDSRCSSAFVTASHWASVGTKAPLTGRS